jgi:hypothetical protein
MSRATPRLTAARDRRVALAVRAVCVVLGAWIAYDGDTSGNPDRFHAGERLAHLDALRAGKLPFRDVYVFHGFGEEVVKPLVATRLFGDSLESLRIVGENAFIYRGVLPALGFAAAIAAVAVWVRSLWVFLAAWLLLLCGWAEITDRHLFAMLAVAALGMSVRTGRTPWLVACGVGCGMALLYSLDTGLHVSAATLIWLAARRIVLHDARVRRDLIAWLLGASIIAAPFLAWLGWHGIVSDFVGNVRSQLFDAGEPSATTIPILQKPPGVSWTPVIALSLTRYLWAPLLALIVLAAAWRSRGAGRAAATPSQPAAMLFAGLWLALAWSSVIRRPDDWHVAFAAGPLVLCMAVFVDQWMRSGLMRGVAAMFLIVPSVVGMLCFDGTCALSRQFLDAETQAIPRWVRRHDWQSMPSRMERIAPVRVAPESDRFFGTMVDRIRARTPEGRTWLDLTDQPLLYYLSVRDSPIRFYARAHWAYSSRLARLAFEDLQRAEQPPACVLRFIDDKMDTPIHDYVDRHYRRVDRINNMELLVPARGG